MEKPMNILKYNNGDLLPIHDFHTGGFKYETEAPVVVINISIPATEF